MKVLFLDTETTGLDPIKNAVTQIAGYVYIDGKKVKSFDIRLQPMKGKMVDQQALDITGMTTERLKTFQSSAQGYQEFVGLLKNFINKYDKKDKFFLCGYNVRFDDDFLRQLFFDHGDQYYGSWFWTPVVDLMTVAGLRLIDKRIGLPNFKLGTVCDALNIMAEGNLHDALTDINLTVQLARVVAPELFQEYAKFGGVKVT